jgi:hypothetical protein
MTWAIAWYREKDWRRWRRICPDFPSDYRSWLAAAEAGFKQHQALGHFPEKITIRPRDFFNWSKAQWPALPGHGTCGLARGMYAVAVLRAAEGR